MARLRIEGRIGWKSGTKQCWYWSIGWQMELSSSAIQSNLNPESKLCSPNQIAALSGLDLGVSCEPKKWSQVIAKNKLAQTTIIKTMTTILIALMKPKDEWNHATAKSSEQLIDWLIMLTIRHNTYQKYVFYFHFEFLSLISCTIKSNIQVVVIVSYILNLKWWWQWDWWKKLMHQSLMKLHGEQLHCNQKEFKRYWFFNTTCWAGIFGKKL